MDAMVERCCGLDVHKATVVACVLIGRGRQEPQKMMRTFLTFTRHLEALRDWLVGLGVTQVAMESTGSYWVPVYRVLETASSLELVVANAQHIKNVPGRKTDVKDAEWIAKLVRHGLVRKSFVPPKDIRELRDFTRFRKTLVHERTRMRNQLLKLLETANVKLGNVVSDVFGKTGTLMVAALIAGEQTVEQMTELACGRLRAKRDELSLALDAKIDEHHRYLLQMQIERCKQVDASISDLDAQIDARLEPYRAQRRRLMQIPGVDRTLAATLIAELGIDMSVFPTAGHVAAWAGVCPGNHESAGKSKRGTTRKGNVHLKTALTQAATSAQRTKETYLRDKYYRLKARRGGARAAIAIARKILTAAYYMLRDDVPYRELGASYLDQADRKRVTTNLVRRLERLGYFVELRAA